MGIIKDILEIIWSIFEPIGFVGLLVIIMIIFFAYDYFSHKDNPRV